MTGLECSEEDPQSIQKVSEWVSTLGADGRRLYSSQASDQATDISQHEPLDPGLDIGPSDSVSAFEDLDPLFQYLADMADGRSEDSGFSVVSAGGDDWKKYRRRLTLAGLLHMPKGPLQIPRFVQLRDSLAQPKSLKRDLRKKLVAALALLIDAIDEPELEESYLEGHMNAIIVQAISEVEAVEIRSHNISWNRVPVTKQRCIGLSCPKPGGTVGYPTKGFVEHEGVTKLKRTPASPDDPLGSKVMQEILGSSLREHAPLNYTSAAKTTNIHEVITFEYKLEDDEAAREIALNQNLNTGFFKVWQDVELARFLGGSWEDDLSVEHPYCLLFRICGTWWALDWVSAEPDTPGEPTVWTTLQQGDWAKDPDHFLKTLKTTYAVSSKHVRKKRGSMMKELLRRSRAAPVNAVILAKPLAERRYTSATMIALEKLARNALRNEDTKEYVTWSLDMGKIAQAVQAIFDEPDNDNPGDRGIGESQSS